jgi:DGQHR domain-containing protein
MMNERLKALLSQDAIDIAAGVAEGDATIEEKIKSIFSDLGDFLFSKDDVAQILRLPEGSDDLAVALNKLVDTGELEYSETTQRPLDPAGIRLYRKKDYPVTRLKLIALEDNSPGGEKRYQFTCDGRLIRSIAKVDRLDALSNQGQQRDEIKNHVLTIAQSIQEGSQVPNPILLVISDSMVATDVEDDGADDAPESYIRITHLSELVEVASPLDSLDVAQRVRTVEIDFPFRAAAFDSEKATLLVDGQQRTAAISLVDVSARPQVPIAVEAIITDEDGAKKTFQIANSTQKIKTEFSRALMASVGDAPGYLKDEQRRAVATKALSIDDKGSPFYSMVRYPGTPFMKSGVVAHNSLFQVVSRFDDKFIDADDDWEKLARLVKQSFECVKSVWPEHWGERPTASTRLMHGASLRALSELVTDLLFSYSKADPDFAKPETWDSLESDLKLLRSAILWGDDALSGNKTQASNWRDISRVQNTSQDIKHLSGVLNKEFLSIQKATLKKK